MEGLEPLTVGLAFRVCRVLRGLGKAEPWDDTAVFGEGGVRFVFLGATKFQKSQTRKPKGRALILNHLPSAWSGVRCVKDVNQTPGSSKVLISDQGPRVLDSLCQTDHQIASPSKGPVFNTG